MAFFGAETNNMMELFELLSSGKGRFAPKTPTKKHVLVLVRCPTQPYPTLLYPTSFAPKTPTKKHVLLRVRR